jgi:type II secretory pathway pseudopilin PulG
MVVLAIITIITGVILTSQGSFNKSLILSNTAYDVALTLRFTETYGLGSRVFGTAVNTGYGLHFDATTPTKFTLFADAYPSVGTGSTCHPAPSYDPAGPSAVAGNCTYDSSGGERVQDYTLGNGIQVDNICAQSSSGWVCSKPTSVCATQAVSGGLNWLDIVFSRPNPTPYMSKDPGYAAASSPSHVTAACLALTSKQGGCKYISVGSSGQISTNATSCP